MTLSEYKKGLELSNSGTKVDIISTIDFIRSIYPDKKYIPLHEPLFTGNERKYVLDAIDSTFVSSVGEYVNRFETMMASVAGTQYAVATVNGTSALHMALLIAGVNKGDEVLSQALTFVATANAIRYLGASPVFIDVDLDTMGMSPEKLRAFLQRFGERRSDGFTFNKTTGQRIKACVPMHTFGFPCRIEEIAAVCLEWNIVLVEDAAESIGSYYKNQHTGSFGLLGIFSFNGNKTLTCGGGGAIVTNDEKIARKVKHLTTQAKVPHDWEFVHDHIGYNYRMPNLNAAMACAQLEQLNSFVEKKRNIAQAYKSFFKKTVINFIDETLDAKANFWLNAVCLNNREDKEDFLIRTIKANVMTRPVWKLLFRLPMFQEFQKDAQENAIYLEERIVNIPSSVTASI